MNSHLCISSNSSLICIIILLQWEKTLWFFLNIHEHYACVWEREREKDVSGNVIPIQSPRIQRLEDQCFLPRWVWGLAFSPLPSTPHLGINKDIFLICDSIPTGKDKKLVVLWLVVISIYKVYLTLCVTWCHGDFSKNVLCYHLTMWHWLRSFSFVGLGYPIVKWGFRDLTVF